MPAGGELNRPRPKLCCSAGEEKELRKGFLHRKLLIASHREQNYLRFKNVFFCNNMKQADFNIQMTVHRDTFL